MDFAPKSLSCGVLNDRAILIKNIDGFGLRKINKQRTVILSNRDFRCAKMISKNKRASMTKKAQLSPAMWAKFILLFGIFIAGTIALLSYYGIITFPLFTENPDTTPNPNALCPKTVEEMGKTCCKATESGEMQAVVSSVYVKAECDCPTPTTYLMPAPEGGGKLYIICDCGCSDG